ncbi:MAG: NYN domain-containing protein [Pseudomonadota bacterium]
MRGEISIEDLEADDLEFLLKQKQVDMKVGMDIAALAYKRLVDRIVLIAGDADFVPAAKLARREGIDFVLDPLWNNVPPSLSEHIDGIKCFWLQQRPKRTKRR